MSDQNLNQKLNQNTNPGMLPLLPSGPIPQTSQIPHTSIDWIQAFKIIVDSVLVGTLAMFGALQLSRTSNPSSALPSTDSILAAFFWVGAPTTIGTLRARISRGLPALPDNFIPNLPGSSPQNPISAQIVQSPNAPPIETHDAHPGETVPTEPLSQ